MSQEDDFSFSLTVGAYNVPGLYCNYMYYVIYWNYIVCDCFQMQSVVHFFPYHERKPSRLIFAYPRLTMRPKLNQMEQEEEMLLDEIRRFFTLFLLLQSTRVQLAFMDRLFRHYLVAPSVTKGYNCSSISEVVQHVNCAYCASVVMTIAYLIGTGRRRELWRVWSRRLS